MYNICFRTAVRLGEWNTDTDMDCEFNAYCSDAVRDIPIAQVITHERYHQSFQEPNNDIALIRLARPVRYTTWVSPICIPTAKDLRNQNFDGAKFTVAGWGKTENGELFNILF